MIRTVENLQKIIDGAFEKRAELSPHTAAAEIIDAVGETLSLLNNGTLRVATPAADGDGWVVHEWLKKAVLLSFRLFNNRVMAGGRRVILTKFHSNSADLKKKISIAWAPA